ncbi:hypothetical protein SAMN05421827_10432 [Pedobacter terrae]|uniref:Uncharacterized protein n=1 Tax=Pedobacter terrae TaxID=405671 RepID=A0A1G7S490_9SPHI|nr:hypothetical protein [Pedobacter terrae]SDG17855.1 hypothetical protein SAMN05421827_10432 [Pedobacter terrae]
MKSSSIYTLKVCPATLVVSVPVTMVTGFGYIGLIMLIKPQNYNFSFNLPFTHVFIFIAIIAVVITIKHYFEEKQNDKRLINNRPITYSTVLFLLSLLISGMMHFNSFDYLLFSYAPMFFTAYLFSRIFSAQKL